jgi:lipopolysaccharide/colanic/teichoic acid biosynthesis glycosyltransferase
VLKGDMSLVGPRPEMPNVVANYTPEQKLRLRVKPGITGVWQISPDRIHPIHENIGHDLYYIDNISLGLDIALILETAFKAYRGKNTA